MGNTDIGYKILGFIVWQAGKWYLRRRYPDARQKLALAGVGGLVLVVALAGARAALRQGNSSP
jgi:uncharacterized membrane protein